MAYDVESTSQHVVPEVLAPFQKLRACRPIAAVAEQADADGHHTMGEMLPDMKARGGTERILMPEHTSGTEHLTAS